MTITIDLSAEEEARMRGLAERADMSPAECARRIVLDRLTQETRGDGTLELLARWEAEDNTDDPEELARRNREWEEFQESMNASRAAAGARLLYP